LQRRPSHSGTLGLGYSPSGRATLSLGALFTGDRDDFDYRTYPAARVTLPPHTRVDASGSYELARPHGTWPGLALTARIENLLDARYEDIKNFPARGRSLLFGGRMRFGT
jgi:outer membrane cobalamin receptor